jgi:hypothetical protein
MEVKNISRYVVLDDLCKIATKNFEGKTFSKGG